jgi:Carboxypeptidase regulatory-like domain/TonB-dependent Receptor Plug Domain
VFTVSAIDFGGKNARDWQKLPALRKESQTMFTGFTNGKRRRIISGLWLMICLGVLAISAPVALAQVDQGTILGTVEDKTGAVIPGATVILTNIDTGLTLERKTNGSGIYVFSPLKIGNYKVSATASGFETTSHQGLHLDIQQLLNVVLMLLPGSVSQTVTVSSAAPLLQTQDAAVGQVISAKTINDTPLNGRNWVYIAQLTAGVAPPFGNTRGSGTGDFVVNGQRAEQNNFILDGVDNNTNLVDFLNGSSFVMRPPPNALSEFSLQTSDFSAEFGHSAGGVMSANIKSGTNHIHGDVWEYVCNTALDAQNWNALTIPPYHQNQFAIRPLRSVCSEEDRIPSMDRAITR